MSLSRSAQHVVGMEAPVALVAVTSGHVTVLLVVPGATKTGSMLPGQYMLGSQLSEKYQMKKERLDSVIDVRRSANGMAIKS